MATATTTALATARTHLQAWLAASLKIAEHGASVQIATPMGSNTQTRATLADVQGQIKYWTAEVARLERALATGGRQGITTQRVILHG